MAFLRRHFLRRSEGKRLSSVADAQLIGGSTRQPRHRPGAGLSGLFSQVRHSAFFPSATTNISDPIEVEKPRRDQPDTHTPSSDWLGLLGTPNPTQKTHIFVDLRTFAGGSPVVALKERLDAQAVADAKASAFAEAAAVLAAAKLASESSNSSCTNSNKNASGNSCHSPRSNTRPSRDLYPILSSSTAVPDSIICSNGSGGRGGNWDGLKQVSETSGINEPESPPVPPVRLHSLGRGSQRPLPQTPGGSSDAPKPFTVRGGFRMDASTTCLSEEDVTGGGGTDLHHTTASESTASSPGGRILSNGHGQDHPIAPFLPARSSATSSASSFFGDCAISSGILHQPSNFSESHQASPSCSSGKGSAFAVSDRRTRNADRPDTRRFSYGPHSPVLRPMESGGQWTTARNPHRPHEHVLFPESMPGPLHVIAEGYVPNQPWPVGALVSDPSVVHPVSTAPIMSSSTISAETPTPTATPTPTPSQTPQPFGSHVLISREDSEFLRHAPWYQALLPRDLAFELLAREDIGSFIVRNSVTHPDCCALSVRVPQQNNPTGITHYLIQRTQNGVRLKGLDKEWPSLRALITHLTVMPEMLPCLLRMPVHANNPVFTQLDEPRGDWDPAHTVHRGSSQDSRSHRVATGPISLQPVTSLPSRPVPPTCASRSYLTTSFSALKGSSTCRVPTVGQSDVHEGRSHSIQFSEPPSDLDSVDVIKRKSHSLGAKAQCASEDAGEMLCKYDGATTTQQSDRSGTRLFRDDDDLVNQECWSRPNASPFDDDDGEGDEDEDYQRLSDFSSMMADLKPARDTEVTSC
ncbi:Tensin [Fasciola gigantica]|uniref:Tensin n=1 Tax=Fasciola gigantica TaxID=46835 RepID=A0A504YID7_FASGI|nr:Tensin [Fasciola gigantica]